MRPEFENHALHFMGIGGSGMSGIARIALARNYQVSGCDQIMSSTIEQLKRFGATVFIGHSDQHLAEMNNGDFLVLSTAISQNHPEVIAAQMKGVKLVHRSEVLAGLMRGFRSVAVAGTHGKTTTTSMLTVALQNAGVNPSFAIGGAITSHSFNGHQGSGDIFVAEADESDGSFTNYKPYGAIITNIELDHVDHFPSLAEVEKIFNSFVNSIVEGGFLVANVGCDRVAKLLQLNNRKDIRIFTYQSELNKSGESRESNYWLTNISLTESTSRARVVSNGKILGELSLPVPGAHNLENALAALIAGVELGIDPKIFITGLENFTGARRRFEKKGEVNQVTVIDDYGHHPTEIEATLKAARQYCPNGKIYVVFQPHRYSRTQAFATEFAKSLSFADEVFLTQIYPASEKNIPGVSSDLIVAADNSGKIQLIPSLVEIINELVSQVKPGDLVIMLGAGDINSMAPALLNELETKFHK